MKKIIKKAIIIVSAIILAYTNYGQVQAANNAKLTEEQIEYYARNIDVNNITKEDILNIYDEMIEEYPPESIADMIEENAEEIEEQGLSKEVISAGAEFIRGTDTQSLRDIIENDIDIEDVKQKIEQGYTPDQILSSVVQETPTEKKVEIATKILLSNRTIKTIITVIIILFIYGTMLRWIIYVKAGKQGWAAIIPVYRQIVMYQICGLSPWLMLLWLVPVIGWLAMLVIAIMKRFCLAKEFERGSLFGFGLLFLPPIFESIIAFNPNIKKKNN